jgi:hypothetical protein
LTEPGELLKVVAPWLTDFGNWIFGALIGLDLVILGAIRPQLHLHGLIKSRGSAQLSQRPGS